MHVGRRPGRPSEAHRSARSRESEARRSPTLIGGGEEPDGRGNWCRRAQNDGVRRLMAVAHYRAVDGEEEGSFEPCTHPGARGVVGEGTGGPTAPARMGNTTAGGGEEVGGELDFRRPRPIPSARMVVPTARTRGSAHHPGSRCRTAESRCGICQWRRRLRTRYFVFLFLLPKRFLRWQCAVNRRKRSGKVEYRFSF
jgi:hypothetical protein